MDPIDTALAKMAKRIEQWKQRQTIETLTLLQQPTSELTKSILAKLRALEPPKRKT